MPYVIVTYDRGSVNNRVKTVTIICTLIIFEFDDFYPFAVFAFFMVSTWRDANIWFKRTRIEIVTHQVYPLYNKILVYSHSTIFSVCGDYSATIILSMQSPQIMLIAFVARQLLPHLGQMYLRVLLGFLVLLPPLGSVPSTSSRETPSTICKSCQPCDSMKSNRSIPGLVIVQPYFGWCSTSSP